MDVALPACAGLLDKPDVVLLGLVESGHGGLGRSWLATMSGGDRGVHEHREGGGGCAGGAS